MIEDGGGWLTNSCALAPMAKFEDASYAQQNSSISSGPWGRRKNAVLLIHDMNHKDNPFIQLVFTIPLHHQCNHNAEILNK